MGSMFPEISVWAIPLAALGFLFQAWPVVLLAPLQQRGNGLGALVGMWTVLAITRIAIFFDPQLLWEAFFWTDPLRTSLFVFVGTILASVYIVRRLLFRPTTR